MGCSGSKSTTASTATEPAPETKVIGATTTEEGVVDAKATTEEPAPECEPEKLTLADLAGKVKVSTPDELKAALLACGPQELEKILACLDMVPDAVPDAVLEQQAAMQTQELEDGVTYVTPDPMEVDENEASAKMCVYC